MSFKRIKNNRLSDGVSLTEIFNEIRMRDEEGHPKTYIECGNMVLELTRASLRRGWIDADVRIFIKD